MKKFAIFIIFFRWMSKKFWIRLFLSLIAIAICQKVYYNGIGPVEFGELVALIGGLIALYNRNRSKTI